LRRLDAVKTIRVLAVLVLLAFAIQVVHVRHSYGTWGIWPGARTPRIPFDGRDYLRANDVGAVPQGAVVLGTAPGNGTILSLPPIADYVPTAFYVRYPDGTVTAYALSGGP
jgi:hypothetical protein